MNPFNNKKELMKELKVGKNDTTDKLYPGLTEDLSNIFHDISTSSEGTKPIKIK